MVVLPLVSSHIYADPLPVMYDPDNMNDMINLVSEYFIIQLCVKLCSVYIYKI